MGMPTYGRSFTLSSSSEHGLGDPSVGDGGKPGPITNATGVLSYYEVSYETYTSVEDELFGVFLTIYYHISSLYGYCFRYATILPFKKTDIR